MFANRSKGFSLVRSLRSVILFTAVAVMALDIQAAQAASGQGPTDIMHFPELEAGFHLLYELRFAEARAQFEIWQKAHPEGALGYASEAASYLFEECYRQGVMTSEFFLDDKRFLGKTPLKPDPDLRAKFFASDKRAQDVAQLRLKADPDNPTALFAMSMSLGMEADYASLVDKRQLDSLKKIREADTYSNKLLKVAPDAADAYLGLGTANYIIGSLPGPKKFFLGFAGVHGDKKKGIEQLEIAATRGHYLRPFAKVLLALTALREKKPEVARTEFTELVAEFPKNPLFARELAKLASKSAKVELLRSRAARAFGLANKLGSGFAHLVIAPVVALVFGGVGSFIGRLRSSRKTSIVPLEGVPARNGISLRSFAETRSLASQRNQTRPPTCLEAWTSVR